ncbi:serine/threonine-protein phosphatase 4 regulatory subunit 2-like [Schistocerca serialis cubense]|uniref:serine/threonine-protein phosphatase 4 regulatory subunit 2-like n=1 Tax=Schistocerca serialis cubense TaxID=2023355 RepID=UPI00214E3FCD|nr:serine/threonine-protein phosphatase 4 regulatory subunit 2-like [Schistocerca serialis cubense]
MENQEEVLQSLEDFAKMKPKEIPKELEEYLEYVAKTGDPVYQWSAVKCLFREKLLKVITDFYESCPTCPNNEFTPCPNVEPFNYENMKASLLERLDSFSSAPFTIQRLCELLTTPTKEYTRVDKFMRAVEKNILVVSTKEPGNRRSDVQSDFLMNGVMDGRALDIGEAIETVSSDGVNLLQTEENEVNVSNGIRIDELDMENRSDIENTSDAVWDKDQRESSDAEKQSAKTSEKNGKLGTENESGRESPKITGQIDVKDETGESQQTLSHLKDKAESDHSCAAQEISNTVTAHEVAHGQKTDSTSVLSTANVTEAEQSPKETESNSSQLVDSVHVEEVSHSEEREQELTVSSTGIVLEADENVSQVSAVPEDEDDVLSNESYSPTQPVETLVPSPPAVVISEIGVDEGEEVGDEGSATVVVSPAVPQGDSTTPGAAVEEVVIATSVTGSSPDQVFRETAVVEELGAAPLSTQQEVVPPAETPVVEELENAMVSEVEETVENVKVLAVEEMQPLPLQSSSLQQQQQPQQQPPGCDESMEVDEQLQLQEEMSMDGDEPMDQTEEMTGVVTEVDS